MGACRPHKQISLAHQSSQTWRRQKMRTQFAVAMCFLCSFWGNFGLLNCLVRVSWTCSWTYITIRSFCSTPDGCRMVEMSTALLTGYAWVGFQCAKCKHDFLPWEEIIINLTCAYVLAECVVCHILLFHCGVRRLQEQCIFSSFASNSTSDSSLPKCHPWAIGFV